MGDGAREELLRLCDKLLGNPGGYNDDSLTVARALKQRLVRELAEDSVPIPVGLPRENK